MTLKETFRGKLRSPKEVELNRDLDLPVGSEVTITIVPATYAAHAFDRFKNAAGSWKNIPESFIEKTYADRHVSTRTDAIL